MQFLPQAARQWFTSLHHGEEAATRRSSLRHVRSDATEHVQSVPTPFVSIHQADLSFSRGCIRISVSDAQFDGQATFAVGDFDRLNRAEFSTGYVPTILLIDKGRIADKFAGNDYERIKPFLRR